jgi:hypothetical protein
MIFSILKDSEEEPIETDPGKLADWITAELEHLDGFDLDGYYLGQFHRTELEMIQKALVCLDRKSKTVEGS